MKEMTKFVLALLIAFPFNDVCAKSVALEKCTKTKKVHKKNAKRKTKQTPPTPSTPKTVPTSTSQHPPQQPSTTQQIPPKVDLEFLASDTKDVQKIYTLWKALQDDPSPKAELLKDFIVDHPDWPLIDKLQKKYEMTFNYQTPEDDVLNWFGDHPPITLYAKTLYAKILLRKGKTDRALELIKKTWYEEPTSSKDLELFQKEFKDVLTPDDHQMRVDRLLANENINDAQKTLEWLNQELTWFPKPQRDLAKMRIDLINNDLKKLCDLDLALQQTKEIFKNDPGLLYEEIKWRRKNKENDKVFALLQSDYLVGIEKGNPTLFWGERNIMVRRMIEEGSFQKAVDLINKHQLTNGEHFINAEWLAAFLLMNYLNKPDEAHDRLKRLIDKVRMPISLSRIYYWLAIAAQKMNAKEQAIDWYKKAAEHPSTYYGQLAFCALEDLNIKTPDDHLFEEENPSLATKQKFEKRELVKALKLISGSKESSQIIEVFFKKLSEQIKDREEYYLLVVLATQIAPSKIAIELARLAPEKQIVIKGTYPVLDDAFLNNTVNKLITNNPLFPHLTHAVIRRESSFDPDAVSSAGAKGLMQVIDQTAQKTVQKLSFLCGDGCTDQKSYKLPINNVAIGTMYLKEMLDLYNNSVVLALCAYNAGPDAVNNLFCGCIGNPLDQKTNMIQWIELIPFFETRNYVMRVLENYMMYLKRARIEKPSIPVIRIIDLIKGGTK
ncbi:MAG: Membrane-bound lytic murein transglycosylase C [Holosporales bacterium]